MSKDRFYTTTLQAVGRQQLQLAALSEDEEHEHDGEESPLLDRKKKKRSAKELWAILRYHVNHESFHIQDFSTADPKQKARTTATSSPFDFTLTECVIAFLLYLLLSVIAYSFFFEGWPVIDSLYFAVVTFTTIGYGDIAPQTVAGKLFTTVFAMLGVCILGIALGVVGSKMVEAEVNAVGNAQEGFAKEILHGFQRDHRKPKPTLYRSSRSSLSSFSSMKDLEDSSHHDTDLSTFQDDSHGSRKLANECMVTCSRLCHLLAHYVPALIPMFLGAFLIAQNEGWPWYDAIYYCVITTTTIGYGDMTPLHASMKLFAVFFIPLAVGAMGYFLAELANFVIARRSVMYRKKLLSDDLTMKDLAAMHPDKNGEVSELDFVIFMLVALKKVDKDLIDELRVHFHNLDLTNSGTLTRGDLELLARRRLRKIRSKLTLGTYKVSGIAFALPFLGSFAFSLSHDPPLHILLQYSLTHSSSTP
jgi:hypothetical protein